MATRTNHSKKVKYIAFALVGIFVVILGCFAYQRYETGLTNETTATNSEASAGRASFFHHGFGFFQSRTNQAVPVPPPAPVVATKSPAKTTTTSTTTNPTKPISTTPTITTTTTTTPPPIQTIPVVPTTPVATKTLQWGAYVGDGTTNLSTFESLVGKPVNILATFNSWQDPFPPNFKQIVGTAGKTLLIYWEPNFGYNQIVNGSEDTYITQFAADAKSYGYPVILVPFDEMNLNENDWGYGANGNTALNFVTAWKHIHDLFAQATNVKFGIAYNNVSIPSTPGNQFSDYYPGSAYVDYVGIDGFNFENPSVSFTQTFTSAINTLSLYNKPLYIFSAGSAEASDKATWITQGLGSDIKTYPNIAGWIWFNRNDGGNQNWLVNSDPAALAAFKSILP